MTEYEFKEELVEEAFGNMGVITARLAEEGTTVEELTNFLNESFDQSARQSIAAMMDDYVIPLEFGGGIRIRERNGFEEWKDRTGWKPTEE